MVKAKAKAGKRANATRETDGEGGKDKKGRRLIDGASPGWKTWRRGDLDWVSRAARGRGQRGSFMGMGMGSGGGRREGDDGEEGEKGERRG